MDYESLKLDCENGLSTWRIADKYQKSQCCVRYRLKKYGLKTTGKNRKLGEKEDIPKEFICRTCNKAFDIENSYKKSNGGPSHYCKLCWNNIAKQKQRDIKMKLVEYKGGKCEICGYDKYIGSLDFHHLNPDTKSFTIAERKCASIEVLKKEANKCILLCSNCHGEVHGGFHKDIIDKKMVDRSVPLTDTSAYKADVI